MCLYLRGLPVIGLKSMAAVLQPLLQPLFPRLMPFPNFACGWISLIPLSLPSPTRMRYAAAAAQLPNSNVGEHRVETRGVWRVRLEQFNPDGKVQKRFKVLVRAFGCEGGRATVRLRFLSACSENGKNVMESTAPAGG